MDLTISKHLFDQLLKCRLKMQKIDRRESRIMTPVHRSRVDRIYTLDHANDSPSVPSRSRQHPHNSSLAKAPLLSKGSVS